MTKSDHPHVAAAEQYACHVVDGKIPACRWVTVTADSLNVRTSPNGTVVGSVPRGTNITIYGSEGDWLQIRTPAGYRGWVHRGHVRPDDDGAD